MRQGAAIALVCVCWACDVETDIVAYGPGERRVQGEDIAVDAEVEPSRPDADTGSKRLDAGRSPSPLVPETGLPLDADGTPTIETDAGVPADPLDCAGDERYLMLIEKSGALSRVRADSLAVERAELLDGLVRGVVAAAVDRQGVLWVSTLDRQLWWISPGSMTCAPSNLRVSPGPLTFVFDRETNRELLYFVDANNDLAVLDPGMFAQTTLGPIETQLLVGTGSEGELLAIGELGDTALSLDYVSLDDAATTPVWKVARKVEQTLMGAAGWRGEVVLLLRSELWAYRRETDTLSWLPTDPPLVGTYVALASSVCGASSR